MSTTTGPKYFLGRCWVSVALVAVCVVLLAAVVIPGIQRARQQALKTQSANNLMNIGSALRNFHEGRTAFPNGADVTSDGRAKHGWFTHIIPYLAASPLYSMIKFEFSWDHPVNDRCFKQGYYDETIPGVDDCYSSEGFGLLHYMANPNVMYRNSFVSTKDMVTGTSNNWLAAEISGDYKPWGYPFNWRPLNKPLSSSPDSFGAWSDGGYFCMADGSVRFLSNSVDESLLTSLANAPPVATLEQTMVPIRRFEYSSTPLERLWFEADVEYEGKGAPGITVLFDRSDRAYMADVYWNDDGTPVWDVSHTSRIDLEGIVAQFPTVRVLILDGKHLTDSDAKLIAGFRDLEILLIASQSQLSQDGRQLLESIPKLQVLTTE